MNSELGPRLKNTLPTFYTDYLDYQQQNKELVAKPTLKIERTIQNKINSLK
jgi:hypothetical protein